MGVQFSFLEITSYFFSLSEVWINIIIIVFFFDIYYCFSVGCTLLV